MSELRTKKVDATGEHDRHIQAAENKTSQFEAPASWDKSAFERRIKAKDGLHGRAHRQAFEDLELERREAEEHRLRPDPGHPRVPRFLYDISETGNTDQTHELPTGTEGLIKEDDPGDARSSNDAEIARRHRAYLARRLKATAQRSASANSGWGEACEDLDGYGSRESARVYRAAAHRRQQNSRRTGLKVALAATAAVALGAGTGLYVLDEHGTGANHAVQLAFAWVFPGGQSADKPATIPGTFTRQHFTKSNLAGNQHFSPAPTRTAVSRKQIITTRLEVHDAQGTVNSHIPLTLRADTGRPGTDVSLRVSGLPEGASLTGGAKQPDGTWTLQQAEVHDIKLVIPTVPDDKIKLSVEAIEPDTGQLAAPPQDLNVAIVPPDTTVEPAAQTLSSGELTDQPASDGHATVEEQPQSTVREPLPAAAAGVSGPPQQSPVTVEPAGTGFSPLAEPPQSPTAANVPAKLAALPPQTVQTPSDPLGALVARADELMALGDVIAARRIYEKAVEMGSIEAVSGLGRTYDPVVYEQLNVRGLKPAPDKAMAWYKKAKAAGEKAAAASIEALSAWLNR